MAKAASLSAQAQGETVSMQWAEALRHFSSQEYKNHQKNLSSSHVSLRKQAKNDLQNLVSEESVPFHETEDPFQEKKTNDFIPLTETDDIQNIQSDVEYNFSEKYEGKTEAEKKKIIEREGIIAAFVANNRPPQKIIIDNNIKTIAIEAQKKETIAAQIATEMKGEYAFGYEGKFADSMLRVASMKIAVDGELHSAWKMAGNNSEIKKMILQQHGIIGLQDAYTAMASGIFGLGAYGAFLVNLGIMEPSAVQKNEVVQTDIKNAGIQIPHKGGVSSLDQKAKKNTEENKKRQAEQEVQGNQRKKADEEKKTEIRKKKKKPKKNKWVKWFYWITGGTVVGGSFMGESNAFFSLFGG